MTVSGCGDQLETGEWTTRERRALAAVAAQFFINGALFASFIPRLPEIRDRVGVTVAGVGLMMSIAASISILGSLVVGRAIERFGSRTVILAAGTLVSFALAVIGLATTSPLLIIGLAGMMTFDVFVDVGMNLQGSWLSARRTRPVMNRLHGLWSLGSVVGGLAAARMAAAGVSLPVHIFGAALVLFAALGLVARGLLRSDLPSGSTSTVASGSSRMTSLLFAFFFAGLFAFTLESTAIDWAAFRIGDDFGASAGVAALGYVAVTAGMTVGRFTGDSMAYRAGPARLMTGATALTGIGLATATLSPNQTLVIVGFAAAGLGVATLLPGLYDRAARSPGRPGAGLGALTAGLRAASLTVPLVVGILAGTSLSVGSAIALVTLPTVAGFYVLTGQLGRRRHDNRGS